MPVACMHAGTQVRENGLFGVCAGKLRRKSSVRPCRPAALHADGENGQSEICAGNSGSCPLVGRTAGAAGGHGCGQIRGRDPVPCTGIFRQIGLPASFGNDRNGKTYRAGRDFASFSGRVKHPGTPEKREWRQGYGFWTDFRQNGASFCGVSRPIQQGMPCPACLTASGY